MKAQYIKHKKQWSAYMTINGLDVQEYGKTKSEALDNLKKRISGSDFLLSGIKVNNP